MIRINNEIIMKIAIPTSDRITVAERSGRAFEFAVIEIEENKKINTIFVENGHGKTQHSEEGYTHEHHGGDLVALLDGVNIIDGKKFGPHFSRDFHAAGVHLRRMKLTKLDNIEDIINEQITNN